MLSTTCLFLLCLAGLCAICVELVRPGLFLPGIAGLSAVVTSVFLAARHSPSCGGTSLVALAAVLFLLESYADTRFVAAFLGTSTLAWGVLVLFPGPDRIPPALAIPLSLAFGLMTAGLSQAAKRARANKVARLRESH